jgi:hypothetical protein
LETDGKLDLRWVLIARQKQNWRPWWNLDVNVNVKRKTGFGDRWETRSQMGVDCKTEAELETMVESRCECDCREKKLHQKNLKCKMRRKKMEHKFYPKLCHRARETETETETEKFAILLPLNQRQKHFCDKTPKKRDKQNKQTES